VGKNNLNRTVLAVGILFLFIASTVTPAVISYDEPEEDDDYLENLAFMCYDEHGGNAKYEYYKEHLLNDYSNDEVEIVEVVEKVIPGGLPLPFTTGPMNSSWPMKCHDTHHTGRSPVGTANIPYDELWRFETDTWMDTSPTIGDDGIIYVGGGYNELPEYLYAIYSNGTMKWRYGTNGLIYSAPAIADDGTIYFGSWDDYLHALNPNGTLKWKFLCYHTDIYSSPAIGEDGIIYFGGMGPDYYGRVFAVYPNGTEKWHYDTDYWITSDPAIGDDGTIYIGSLDNCLYALYPNGTLKWQFQTGDWIQGPPSIADDGTIYFGSLDGYLYALYPNGTLRWQTDIWYGSNTNPSIGEDGAIYICSASKLFAIYPNNGTIKWEFDLGGSVGSSSSVICADGIIYTGTEIGDGNGGEIVAVNSNGTEKWRKRISNCWVESSPAIGSDGTVYICSSSFYNLEDWGALHAFGRGEIIADANGPYIGIMNEPVQFTGSASGGYPPYGYLWDFGNGETSEEQNPSYEYTSAGNYTVNLAVTDDNDTTVTDTTYAVIRESNDPPGTPNIEGETHGYYGESYDYSFIATDPNKDDIW